MAVRPLLMDALDAHLDALLQERLPRQPSTKETGRADVQLGRGRGRLVRTTWEDGLVPMQGAIVAWADGYDLFTLVAWAEAKVGGAFAEQVESLCRGVTPTGVLGKRVDDAVERLALEVPELSHEALRLLVAERMSQGRGLEDVPQAALVTVSRGLDALAPAEASEMRAIYQQVWAPVPEAQRVRLAALHGRPQGRTRGSARGRGAGARRGEGRRAGAAAGRPRTAAGALGPRGPQVAARAMSRASGDLPGLAEKSRERFEELASRLGARRKAGRPALTDDYWQALRDLFTRDVTHQGLRELIEHEAQETFRFLTREVSVSDLERLPWYQRKPKALWRFFLAVAYRLSPWRRVLFAAGTLVLVLGWVGFVFHLLSVGPFSLAPFANARSWLLIAGTVLFFLLALELRDKLGLKGDLEVARQIQFGLLPFEQYERPGRRASRSRCGPPTPWAATTST